MERFKLLGSIFFVVLCICFISLPVHSGEYPWDNQEGGNGDGTGNESSDSLVIVIDGEGLIPLRTATPGPGSDDIRYFISHRFSVWYTGHVMSDQRLRVIETKESAIEYRGVYRSKKLMD